MKKAALLAAGEGVRLKSIVPYKPIAKIDDNYLLDLTFENLGFNLFEQVTIIFNQDHAGMPLEHLQSLKRKSVKYFFKKTSSSMHSLFEVIKESNLKRGEHLFCSMVDSIVHIKDAQRFHHFIETLAPDQSAIMVTSYIDDEMPLTLKINADGCVSEFQCDVDIDTFVTSGVYCFSADIVDELKMAVEQNQHRMRNFLHQLLMKGHTIKAFKVDKTIDVDRPEDIQKAQAFLRGHNV